MTNVSRRFAERGDGGADPARSGFSLIDLENNCRAFNFILPNG
jgi:hypothetical protein